MNCALVDEQTDLVVNIIVADPAVDPAPAGMLMIALPPDSGVSIGWIYDPNTGQFIDPNPPVPTIDTGSTTNQNSGV